MQSVALRERSGGIGLVIDHIERVAAGTRARIQNPSFRAALEVATRILWPAQHEFLDLNRLQRIRQREHADAVRTRIDRVKELSVGADQRPARTCALSRDRTRKAQIASRIEREDADLIGPGKPGVDDVLVG